MREKSLNIQDLLLQKSFHRSNGLVNFKVYGKSIVCLILRVIMLGVPEWPPCTYSFHLPDDSQGFYF